MPASLGEMCFQTPMLPWRMLCPAASSMKKSGTPTMSRRKTYSSMKAPGETRGMYYFTKKQDEHGCKLSERRSPPPFWWQRYGNLQTLPRPTLNPTWANTYWILESHAGRSSSDASGPSAPVAPVSWLSDRPSASQPLLSVLSSGGFSVWVEAKTKTD